MSRLLLAALLTGLLVVSGCSSTTTGDGDQSKPAHGTPSANVGGTGSQHVDPQVLADVVDTAFPVPGPSMRRYMRVNTFIGDFIETACGSTEHTPIDETWDRYEQDEFPDLALIEAKGLNQKDPGTDRHGNPRRVSPPGFRKGCTSHSKGNLDDRMPSNEAFMNLQADPWGDVVATVEQDPSVVALKAPFAQCLRDGTKGTGMVISSVDPAAKFMTQLGLANYEGKVTTREINHRLSDLFVRCGRAYFGRVEKLLKTKRPAQIERNRELLEKAASQLVAIGYTP